MRLFYFFKSKSTKAKKASKTLNVIKKLLYIIVILFCFNSYSQEDDFTDLNEKTVFTFLTDDGFIINNTETSKEGYKIYSSFKDNSNSQLQRKLIFLNGYPLLFEVYFKGYMQKNLNYDDINNPFRKIIKSMYEKDKKKYNNIEFSSENEYYTKKDSSSSNMIVQYFGSYGEDDNIIYKIQKTSASFNFNQLPFFKGVVGYNGEEIKIVNVSTYNIEDMIKLFIKDLKYHIKDFENNNIDSADSKKVSELINNLDKIQIKATFDEMENETLAVSYGINNDNNILVKVNPVKWTEASNQKKWYIIYHELGHDVLNFHHGEGDKMMFNFIDKKYTWNEFFEDRKKMFDIYFNKKLIQKLDNIKINFGEIKKTIATINIGTQEWMTRNLSVSKYKNGDVIPEVKDSKKWSSLTTGAWCYYNNDPKNGAIYGKLYNWYAVNDPRGLAPEGVHIPSIFELNTITNLDTLANGKMIDIQNFEDLFYKSKNKVGHIMKSSGFEKRIQSVYYWSSSECDNYDEHPFAHASALSLVFGYDFTIIEPKKYLGLYVRCIKD